MVGILFQTVVVWGGGRGRESKKKGDAGQSLASDRWRWVWGGVV